MSPSWSGAFEFGAGWAAFRGQAGDNSLHAHMTLQVVLSCDPRAVLRTARGGEVTGPGLLVRSGVPHVLAPCPDATLIFLEPQTPLASHVDRSCAPGGIVALADDLASQMMAPGPLSHRMATLAAAAGAVAPAIDPRLAQALAFLATEAGPRALSRAAALAGLSTARLRALAHARLGTSLATWRAWRRFERAGQAMAAGATLAQAAAEAGFADQAHFSRAMRRTFGITPGAARGLAGLGERKVQDRAAATRFDLSPASSGRAREIGDDDAEGRTGA